MRISMMGTSNAGGAGRAMMRLAEGLIANGHECNVFVKSKIGNSGYVYQTKELCPMLDDLIGNFFNKNVYPGRTLMSAMYSGAEFSFEKELLSSDIIHFHWVANFVSPEFMARLNLLGKPLIWTMHDMNPMSGGCHCIYDCDNYINKGCHYCPQLRYNPYDITSSMLSLKVKYIPKDMLIVSPSRKLAERARRSAVFKEHRIEVIPNSVELDVFHPYVKGEAKARLGVHQDCKLLLYGAEIHTQIHKGFDHFINALRYICERTDLARLKQQGKLKLLLVGRPSPESEKLFDELGLEYISLGYLHDDNELAQAYSAADVAVLSSIEDNLPNMMLEALACGTPVVGFRTGGIPDIVKDGYNGYVAEWGNDESLGDSIVFAVANAEYLQANCRPFAEIYLNQKSQALAYQALYEDLLLMPGRVEPVPQKSELSVESLRAFGPYLWEELKIAQSIHQKGGWAEILLESNKFVGRLLKTVSSFLQREPYEPGTLALYGAGRNASDLLSCLKYPCHALRGIFDKKLSASEAFCGYPVLDMKRIEEYGLQAVLITSLKYEQEIAEELAALPEKGIYVIRLSDIYVMDRLNKRTGDFARRFVTS